MNIHHTSNGNTKIDVLQYGTCKIERGHQSLLSRERNMTSAVKLHPRRDTWCHNTNFRADMASVKLTLLPSLCSSLKKKKKKADFFTHMTIHSCAKRLQSRTNHWQGRLNVGGWYQHTPRIGTGTVIYFPQLFFEQFACFETTEIKWHCTPPTWRHLREDGLTWRKKKTFLENAPRRVGSCLESKYTQRLACGLLHWTNMEHLICRVHVNKHLSHRATDMLPLTLASGN